VAEHLRALEGDRILKFDGCSNVDIVRTPARANCSDK
jgi:hypothetical protein